MHKHAQRQREKIGPEVMSVRELADYLRVSVHTVYRLAEQGKLPGRKVGKHWRFHRDVIVEWLATHYEEDVLIRGGGIG